MNDDENYETSDHHKGETMTLRKTFPDQAMNKCEIGQSNFIASLRVVALKLLEVIQFTSPNLPVY